MKCSGRLVNRIGDWSSHVPDWIPGRPFPVRANAKSLPPASAPLGLAAAAAVNHLNLYGRRCGTEGFLVPPVAGGATLMRPAGPAAALCPNQMGV